MKRRIALVMILALCGLLSSCKRPISGQISVVTDSGANVPLGAVEIVAIRGKDADDFLRQRQVDIENKIHSLQKALGEMRNKYAAAMVADSQAQSALAAAGTNEKAFGPNYAALQSEKTNELQTIETLTETIDNLNQQLGSSKSTGATASTSQRYDTYSDIQTDEDRSRQLRGNINRIDARMAAIKNNFLVPYRNAQAHAARAVVMADADVNAAATALKRFPTANDYFDGFSPDAIETTVTDADGNFIIQHAKSGAKIYARAQRQTAAGSVENYFWLVDLPAKGGKLILSNNNRFASGPPLAIAGR